MASEGDYRKTFENSTDGELVGKIRGWHFREPVIQEDNFSFNSERKESHWRKTELAGYMGFRRKTDFCAAFWVDFRGVKRRRSRLTRRLKCVGNQTHQVLITSVQTQKKVFPLENLCRKMKWDYLGILRAQERSILKAVSGFLVWITNKMLVAFIKTEKLIGAARWKIDA